MPLKRLTITNLANGESYYPAFAGEYLDHKGRRCWFSNPQGVTLAILKDLPTAEEQLEFFCYACLWQFLDMGNLLWSNPKALNLFKKLQSKYGIPWYGNTRHTLPLGGFIDPRVLTKNGLDRKKLKEEFKGYLSYKFVLYRSY